MLRYLCAIALMIGGLSARAEEPLPTELTPTQQAAALKAAETSGRAMYLHDRAAAAATDAARELRAFRRDKRVAGWITEAQGDQIVVTFIDNTPAALYRVTVSKDGVAGQVSTLEAPATLTPYEAGAATARAAARATKFQPCAERYNTVVLPASDGAPEHWAVYLIPATTKQDLMPIGGAYRMDVDGATVVSQRGFTRSCIALQLDRNVASLMITHLLDPVPTEVHVFWSLWAGKPIYVATPPPGTIWKVDAGSIGLVKRAAAGG